MSNMRTTTVRPQTRHGTVSKIEYHHKYVTSDSNAGPGVNGERKLGSIGWWDSGPWTAKC